MIFIVTHPLATGHPSSQVLYWLGWSFDPKNCKKHWIKIYDTYLASSCLCPQCSQVVSGNQLNPPSIQEKRLCCSIASRHITCTRFPTRRFSRNSNPNRTLQRRDRGNRTVSIFKPWSFPKRAKRIQQIPWNRKREEAPKMAVTNLSNLPRLTRGQANEAWVPYKITLVRGRLRRQPRLSPSE